MHGCVPNVTVHAMLPHGSAPNVSELNLTINYNSADAGELLDEARAAAADVIAA